MKLLFILQIYVNSFVNIIKEDTVYISLDSCQQIQSLPEIKKGKIKFTYNDFIYAISYYKYNERHVKEGNLFYQHVRHSYTYGIGNYLGQNYNIRIHEHNGYKSIWLIPIDFVKNTYGTKRGFLFSDDPVIISHMYGIKLPIK